MKTLVLLITTMLFVAPPSSVYDFKIKSIDGKEVKLSKFKGKKILIVNTASKCGFTPQYADLEKLAEEYKDKLVIIGFPANNFANQEPGENLSIQEFCRENYGVTFLMAEKTSVKGDDISPLFKYLTSLDNVDFKGDIQWNFEKFLIDEKGKLVHRYRSSVTPLSQTITNQL